ncbi:MAG: enoyl-CoA hydratase [Chloroflexota bacterium]|nr:enoyl-CoA hydratase [Chloroflexota bacterium]
MSVPPPSGTVELERRGDLAWLTFDRPEARNAFTREMYARLTDVCAEVDTDDAVRVVVVQGRGDQAFVSGSDIASVGRIRTREDALAYETHVERAIGALERISKPTIALVRGVVTGGGAALALACDLRVGADNARVGMPIARTVGNTLSLRNFARMVETLGPSVTKQLVFTAELVDAETALRLGFFNEVVPLPDIEARVTALAGTVAANAPVTVRTAKLAVRRVLDARRDAMGSGEDLVELAYLSEDFREGVAAFLEKRKPRWRGA